MGTYAKIPESTFDEMQFDVGILLNTFDPASPSFTDSAIVCATTGGITVSCTPTFVDMGKDVDNCPNNMKELKQLEGWDCKMAFTSLGVSPELIKMSLGCADIDSQNTGKVIPRASLDQGDFKNAIWWVGDRTDGGFVAVKLMNALSTGGFSLKTTKRNKGQLTCELTGHVSINAQDVVPMEFYSIEPANGG